MHQVDDIIVIKDGNIIEHGSFDQLMKNKGHLATLVGEHVQIIEPPPLSPLKIQPLIIQSTKDLTNDQIQNRRRLSFTNNIPNDDQNIAVLIEENQLNLMGAYLRRSSNENYKAIERNQISMMTEILQEEGEEENEVIPEDAEPMKLVLEDQSIFYKESPYISYLKAGPFLPIINTIIFCTMIIFFFLTYGLSIGRDYWLSMWYAKSLGLYRDISNEMFISVFAIIICVGLVVLFLRGLIFAIVVIGKSIDLHNKMFKTVISASMNFFDTTPIGRILNAFSRHMNAIDATISDSLFQMMLYLPVSAGAILLIVLNMYETLGVFGGATVLVVLLLLFLGKIEGRLKSKEAVTRSTIFSHLTATLEGLLSVRAYECEERFIKIYRFYRCIYLYHQINKKFEKDSNLYEPSIYL